MGLQPCALSPARLGSTSTDLIVQITNDMPRQLLGQITLADAGMLDCQGSRNASRHFPPLRKPHGGRSVSVGREHRDLEPTSSARHAGSHASHAQPAQFKTLLPEAEGTTLPKRPLCFYCPNLYGTARQLEQTPGFPGRPPQLPRRWSCNKRRKHPHKSQRLFGNAHVVETVFLALEMGCLVEQTEAHVLVGLLLLCAMG